MRVVPIDKRIHLAPMAVALLLTAQFSFSQNTVSLPVGVTRIEISATNSTLVSNPFNPFDDSVEALFRNQLEGPTNIVGKHRILKWDTATSRYVSAVKPYGPAYTLADVTWYEDEEGRTPSDMKLNPGDGFWVENGLSTPQNIYLCGQVILSTQNTVNLSEGLNLFSYPYSSKIRLDKTMLQADGALAADDMDRADVITDTRNGSDRFWLAENPDSLQGSTWVNPALIPSDMKLRMGSGYWYQRTAPEILSWTESLPYTDVFPTNNQPPNVMWMGVNWNNQEVRLSVEVTGNAEELIDIFFQDISVDETFTPETGWHLGVAKLRTDGSKIDEKDPESIHILRWSDNGYGADARSRITKIFTRYYLAARADIDSDSDDLPDAREQFIHGTDPTIADTDKDDMPDGWEVRYGLDPLVDDRYEDLDGDGINNLTEYINGTNPQHARHAVRTVYVDPLNGNDVFTGTQRTLSNDEGPKRTIAATLASCIPGDTVVLLGGQYEEGLNDLSIGVTITTEGNVYLK